MMNKRHLNLAERKQLRTMADEAGAVEMLRCIAQIIAHDHPLLDEGTQFRTDLNRIAGRLNDQQVDVLDRERRESERRTAEEVMGCELADIWVEVDGKLEEGYVKVINGSYCDFRDRNLQFVGPGPIVKGVQCDTWKSLPWKTEAEDNDPLFIPRREESANKK